MRAVDFVNLLRAEFRHRRSCNARYSLRAYALALRTSHSTLSQYFDGRRPLTARTVETLGWRLGLTPLQLKGCLKGLRMDRTSRGILRLIARERCVRQSRAIATALHTSVDDVNRSLQRLLRRGLIEMTADGWRTR
jgi:hypothetical protein